MRSSVESRNDPAVVQRSRLLECFLVYGSAFGVEQAEPRRVPDLVGEVAIRLDLLLVPTNVSAADLREREARGVDAKLVEHVDRIDAVHLRLRHALAVAVENRAGDEHVFERLLADEL